MNQIPKIGISMGKYVVSPATHPTDCGRFRASFAVHRSQGNGSYCRVFRFDRTFASRDAARLFAVTQGWLQTSMPQPQAADGQPAFIASVAADCRATAPFFHCAAQPAHHPFRKNTSMSVKIYVGNLPYSVTDSSLESNFSEFGAVTSAKVMMDRETGRSKGFGFVEMATAEVAQAAITGLNGVSVDGRAIVVNLARPREAGGGSGGGGYNNNGYSASNRSDVGYGNGGHGGGRY